MNTKITLPTSRRLIIAQPANPPIIGWAVVTLINFGVHSGLLSWLGSALLFTWAFLEVWQGVNWFRRSLGLVVLAGLIYMHLN